MADEQDWASYPDQAFLSGSDTLLIRTAAGAGMEVPAGKAFLYRNSAGQHDATNNTVTLAAGASADFSNFSGVIIANNFSTGSVGLYLCGGGSVVLIGNTTASPPGSVTFVSGISGYRFTNTGAAAYTFCLVAIRTRTIS